MNADSQIVKTQELIFVRLLEDFSQWVLVAPVVFAFAVVFLVLFYRQPETLTGLLKHLFIPPAVVTWLGLAWGIWLLVFAVAGIWIAMNVQEPDPAFFVWGLVPLVAFPVLLAVLATMVICA